MRVQTAFNRMLRLPGASVTNRCVIECELRRLRCPDCGVHLEAVPWARPGSQHTRDLEDVVAWLAQQMAKTPITGLLRIGWDTVGKIVARVVADHLDESHVVDHQTGAIVWCSPGRNAATLQAFFSELGERRHSIRAVSIDMSGGYEKAVCENAPHAEVCFDPFHVVRLAQRAVDQVRRDECNAHDRSHTPKGRWIKNTRWSLLKSPDKQSVPQLALLGEVQQANKAMCLARLGLPVALCAVRQARPHDPPPPRGEPRRDRTRTQQRSLEGLNSRIRLISHRSFGFHSAEPLIALVYLAARGSSSTCRDDLHPELDRSTRISGYAR